MALFTPTEITDNYAKASIAKAESPAWRLFLLAVAAGVFIGLGAVTSSTAAHALENAGMVRLVSGLIFPIGLMMVILLGTELFTGNALMVTAECREVIIVRTQVMAVPAEPGRHRNPAKTGGTANKGQKQAVPVR